METTTIDYPRGVTFEQVWAAIQENEAKDKARSEEVWKALRETSRQMGELHNTFGEMTEHLVAPGIARRFSELGYKGDILVSANVKLLDKNRTILTEIDLLLETEDCIIAVEVKSKPAEKDVARHIERLEILREHRNKLQKDGRKIRGAVAGAVFPQNMKRVVIDAGLYVLEQSGDTVKIDLPNGFVPREW